MNRAKRTRLGVTGSMFCQKQRPPSHSGRWTYEEEAYVEGLIVEFDAGRLPIAEGTTLRSFLAMMLNCNPKRVSKKYDGNPIYNGKAVYSRTKFPLPNAEACTRQENLLELELKFREALLTMQRVESRLQSLTGNAEKQEKVRPFKSKSAARPPFGSPAVLSMALGGKVQFPKSCQSNSEASSLTDEEGATMSDDIEPIAKMVETSTQVLQTVGHFSELQLAHAASLAGPDGEAACRALMQMNASKPHAVHTATAKSATLGVTTEEASQDGALLLGKLYTSQTHQPEAANSQLQQPTTGTARKLASHQPPRAHDNLSSNANFTDYGSLQTILDELNNVLQRQGQHQTSAASLSSDHASLQGYFSGNTAPAPAGSSRQLTDARPTLQDLLLFIQQKPSSKPLPSANIMHLLQQFQMSDCNPPSAHQSHLQQPNQAPQNLETLIAQVLRGLAQPLVRESNNMNTALIQVVMEQSSAVPQQASAQTAWQQTCRLLLHSMLQTNQETQVQPPTASNLQAAVTSVVSQAFNQITQPQQQPNLDPVLAALVSQLDQNNFIARREPHNHISGMQNAASQTNLIATLQQSLRPSQAPTPPATTPVNVSTMQMQMLLAQLQQTHH